MIKITDKIYDVGTLPEPGTLPKQMHAWTIREERFGEPITSFKEEIVNVPRARHGEVVIANISAGVNYNGVWAALGKPKNVIAGNGSYDDDKEDFHICGSECAGIVYEVGEGVTNLKAGDYVIAGGAQFDENCELVKSGGDPVCSPTYRVWGYESNWGAFAQFSRVKAYQCMKKPEHLSWNEAAVLMATGMPVYKMLTHWKGNQIKKGDVVLIFGGSGGLGSMAIQLAKYFEAIPVAVVSTEEKGAYCMELGAKGYLNRKNYNHWGRLHNYLDPKVEKKWLISAMKFKKDIWRIVGAKHSPDIVVEHPGADTIPTSLFVCEAGGMVVTCGATSSYRADFDLRYLWLYQKRLQGSHSSSPEQYDEFYDVIVKSGIKPHIDKIMPWDKLPEAHQMLHEGKTVLGKLAISIVPQI